MAIWKRKVKQETVVSGAVQIRSDLVSQYGQFNRYNKNIISLDFLDELRMQIPPLDLAPNKINRLIGDFEIIADSEKVQKKLEDFKSNVIVGSLVGGMQRGFELFQYQLIDSAIVKGFGIGEIVPTLSYRDVAGLNVGRANSIEFITLKDGTTTLGQSGTGYLKPFERMEYICYLSLDTRDGDPRGVSMYASLPFVSQIMLRAEKAFENTVVKIGEPMFMVKVTAGSKASSGTPVADSVRKKAMSNLAEALKLRKQGKMADMSITLPEDVTLEIETIGDGKVIDNIEFPLNTIIDQICGRTGLPHWMLGFRRSQGMNSDLSDSESDMVTADVEWFRSMFDPIIDKVLDTYLFFTGDGGQKWRHEWPPMNLRNDKNLSESRRNNAFAQEKELANLVFMIDMGFYSDEQEIESELERIGVKSMTRAKGWLAKRLIERESERIMKALEAGKK
jgi:hypothetical protein